MTSEVIKNGFQHKIHSEFIQQTDKQPAFGKA